jgi:two-component system, chemotaxis family, protein-glutamate methylesterase/glutaminase
MGVKVLAVGASAGGVEALRELVADLPAELGACVLVTVHTTPTTPSSLPRILARAGRLPAVHADDDTPLQPDTIVVAPPDWHLLVGHGRIRLGHGPKINRHRPSVDAMFTSAARWAGPEVVAVVLSGNLDDGAVGAAVVARTGGRVFVQNPDEARFGGMPRAALAAAPAAVAAPLATLAPLLVAAVATRPTPVTVHQETPPMNSMAREGDPLFLAPDETRLTRLACPDCRGTLARIDLPTISYYRCHVGHQWSPQSLAAAQTDTAETLLWAATAALEEQAAFQRHLATSETDEAAADHHRAAQRAIELTALLKDHLGLTPRNGQT